MSLTWDEDMIERLRKLRREGEPLLICAEQIGVTYAQAVYKARELDLAQRLNRGRRPGRDIARYNTDDDEIEVYVQSLMRSLGFDREVAQRVVRQTLHANDNQSDV